MIITLTISNLDSCEPLTEQQKSVSFHSDREYSIGRLHETGKNDWNLPDTENKISRRHASILFKQGKFFIRDENSVSGIWFCASEALNEEEKIDGELVLSEGNILFIGFYEIHVSIEESSHVVEDVIAPSIADIPDDEPDDVIAPSIADIPDDEPDDVIVPSIADISDDEPDDVIAPSIASIPDDELAEISPVPVEIHVQSPPAPVASKNDFLKPFLEGLGIHLSEEELSQLKTDEIKMLGQSFKEAVNGMIKLNRMRDKIKIEFDLDDTVFLSNNILKKSNDAGLALKTVMTSPKNYMPLDNSVVEICQNVDELLCVMMGLLKIPAKRIHHALAPNEIERLTDRKNSQSGLFSKQKKWEVYCEQHNKLSVDDEIAIAYKEELAKYEYKKRR